MIKINGEVFEKREFPNGESLIDFKNTQVFETNFIEYYFDGDDSLIELMFIKKEIDFIGKHPKVDLYIKYMPYSRMDRRMETFAFTLKHICEFINDLGFNSIVVDEPHSDMSVGLLDDARQNLTSLNVLDKALVDIDFDVEKDYIVLPDSGAEKRYTKPLSEYYIKKTMVGVKNRDLQSGKIISFDLIGDMNMQGGRAVILDDLCSKGGTFLATAAKLKERNCSEVYLVVAHLENNVNSGSLPTSDLIERVYSTNSIYTDVAFKKLTLMED